MKYCITAIISLALFACGGQESGTANKKTDTEVENSPVKEQAETAKAGAEYVGSWKVASVDGEEVKINQVFAFNEDGTMVQTILEMEIPGTWKKTADGIATFGATGGEDLLKILSVSDSEMEFEWKGKVSKLTKM